MARRKGLIRRAIDGFGHFLRRETPSIPKSTLSTPGVNSLRRQAVDSIMRLPMVNTDAVEQRVKYMTIDELRWTIKATVQQLRWRARQDTDRLEADDIPLNPWWYK